MDQTDNAGPGDPGPSDDVLRAALDLGQLEALEADLADAAGALEQVEQIRRSGVPTRDRAVALNELVNDPRFVLVAPDLVPPDLAPSDLVRNGDLGAVQQVEAIAEA